MLRAWRFAAIMLTALSAGMSFSHLLEMPPRLFVFDAELWIGTTTGGLYYLFGTVGAVIEIGSVLATLALAWLTYRQKRAALTLTAGGLVVLALFLWGALVAPVNAELAHWSVQSYPDDWSRYRTQWELAHSLNAVIKITALALLTLSALAETGQSDSVRLAPRRQPSRQPTALFSTPVRTLRRVK
jgi:hypothetical protein